MKKSFFYLVIFILFILLSCKNKNDSLIDTLLINEHKVNLDSLNNIKDVKNCSDDHIPSPHLFIGQKLSINYIAYGCFTSLDETITIIRLKDEYLVIRTKKNVSNEICEISKQKFNAAYLSVLTTFCLNCKKSTKYKLIDTLKNEKMYSLATTHKLIVNDGLHNLELFIDNENIFCNLIRPVQLF